MEGEWKQKRLYPLLGTLSILLFLYFNFSDYFNFPVLWLPAIGFVGTNSTKFVIVEPDGSHQSTLYINGWNSYWLMEESVWAPSRSRVSNMLRRGAEMGMSVCRTWAFNDGDGPNSLQISPGVFNERVFQGLDYVIVEARRHQVRLILSLVNNLNAYGGKAQYVRKRH